MSRATVFVHSTGTMPSLWEAVPDEVLAGGARVAPANLGYPPNAPVPRGQHVDAAAEVEHLLAQIPGDADEVHLVAHSYGGLIALKMLPRLGGRVRSLFLYEPVLFGALARDPGTDPAASEEAQQFLGHPWFLRDEARGGTEPWLEVFVDYWNRPGSWAKMPQSLKDFSLGVGWKMFQEVRACFLDDTPFEGHPTRAIPMTLAMGSRSPKASRAMVKGMAKANPQASVVELQGTGHMGPLTHPALVHAAMLDHVRGLT